MIRSLSHVCIVVRDYDEALQWYTEKLGLTIKVNESNGSGFRWVTVSPKGQENVEIVLYQTSPDEKDPALKQVGMTSGWVFDTDNCKQTVEELRQKGVQILMEPNYAPWGTQAVFTDLYGNKFVLVEPRTFTQQELDEFENWDPTER
ncbi:VOC family protein [Thermoflavimicrobium dichotomicum]|uniref:Catechol 2,3-dioxygenase n=1 Tax=Thermoflavimicrobium dichotomicum TaxID=46223 RepID=A0A1I3P6V2_9BACL|nr:VOC family protein [Thermoflavimicrobium dichotomicum]SFJ16776.1 Catechol 2,3-dioxygenase [Thermoflavimicrobium dichotomicum]